MAKVKCPKCGSDDGFYIKTQVTGSTRVCYDGEGVYLMDGANSAIYDHLNHKDGKVAYCMECDRKIDSVANIEKNYNLSLYEKV
ncbi:hypothetical protein NSA50_18455 [Clostridium sp. DSM 100503]|uniref:hypothetical protein n=1 Tax=Clostridium sp. DSM 100503 TaxID=2963282 RepID=UPI002149FE69|nr:hypothetical protein [Clostridium sp. DSM 100503]MCR1952985.1 hypothetical protein [Clostridium sp. DSM 100503]